MEKWKIIEEFEDYQISNLGNVKSLKFGKERIIKKTINNGYYKVILCNKGKTKTIRVHQLVAMFFLDHKPCGHKLVVDHIDNNKLNNNILNLQLLTNCNNIFKDRIKKSKYIGVSIKANKFRATYQKNKKSEHLGYFKTEIEAYNAYQNRLLSL